MMPRRRPLTTEEMLARLPRAFRPRLTASQRLDLGLVHVVNLDVIVSGQAPAELLWELAGGVYTWSRVAEQLGLGVPQMRAQLEMLERMVERFARTGRVGFSGTDYQLAKEGTQVMDELAAVVDEPTAVAAAQWSEAYLAQVRVSVERRPA